jgi:hypothetical protein
MLLRISLAALAVFTAAVAVAEPVGSNRAAAEAQRSPTPTRPDVRAPRTGPTVQQATTSFRCNYSDGTTVTYTLSVNGGSCNRGTKGGECHNAAGSETKATCQDGCGFTKGSGSCTQTTTPR